MAEGLLYLANYHKNRGELDLVDIYCSKLLCYSGPEGGQARAILRDIRATNSANERLGGCGR